MTLVITAWAVYGVIVIASFLFSVLFTQHFKSKHESESLATLVTMTSLGLTFATLALLPLDIFLVSSTVDYSTGLKKSWATPDMVHSMTFTVLVVSYVCYGMVAVCSFFLVPFAYFYYEEYEEEGQPRRERVIGALKYTSFFVIVSTLLFLFGLFLKPSTDTHPIDLDWFKKLLTENNGEKAIMFVIGMLVLLGMLALIGYTAPGLAILPFTMIKGKRSIDVETDDVDNRLVAVRERRRALLVKPRDTWTAQAERQIEYLEDEERILMRRLDEIQDDRGRIWTKLSQLVRPFEMLFGLVFLGLTLIVAISMFLSIVEKLSTSLCGHKCGYLISNPKRFNLINYIFVGLSKAFPLDYVFMVALVLYFVSATMSGMISIGIRFLWVKLYEIRKRATAPQGLLLSSILLTLCLLALNYVLTTTVAPGYAHFGSQVYCNETTPGGRRDCHERVDLIVPCSIDGPTDICTPTVTSTLVDKMIVNTPFFGVLFYYAQWAFLLVFLIALVMAIFRRPRNNVDGLSQDAVDAEEEERLLRSSQHMPTYTSASSS